MHEGKALLANTTSTSFQAYEDRYGEALEIVSIRKKKPELIELDRYIHEDLTKAVNERSPPHLVLGEIASLMKWKLMRGKSRPLQKLVESNSPKAVEDATREALQHLRSGNIDEAFAAADKLKGIGVATASALFCLFSPEHCPFMSDEVIETICSTRKYNLAEFNEIRRTLTAKAKSLGRGWTAERIGQAIWAYVVIEGNTNNSTKATKKTKAEDPPTSTKEADTTSAGPKRRRIS
jgi:hypothetical protein